MAWLANNWSFLVVFFSAVVLFIIYSKKFAEKPSSEQIIKLKEWLLWAVVQAEKELGGKVGVLKLRMVYDMAVSRFPSLMAFISFELFSKYVDEALEQMRHLLESNERLKDYVEGV